MGTFTNIFGQNFDVGNALKVSEEALARKTKDKGLDENTIKEFKEMLKEVLEELEKMGHIQRKMAMAIFDLHESKLINDDTFKKLDGYLKEYYPEPYKQDKY